MLAHDVDGFLDAPAAGHDIFGHDETFLRRDLKSSTQHQAALLFLLREDVSFAERAAYFLADDDSAQRRRNDGVARKLAQFIGEPSAHLRGDSSVLQEEGALEELPAVQTGTQDEMPVEECPGLAKE